ncbi:MAG: CRISPR-associated protein [Bacteroidales bacterium]|nr:CRISPR-associated protein [Bacteroidales bacterium]
MTTTKYTYRFLARLIIEAKTPLAVGSGEKDITSDALVATDVNGLPYIPGTAIAGVIRHMIGEPNAEKFFGWQKDDKGHGSEIIFTDAKILDSKCKVIDGLNLKVFDDPLLKHYKSLPIRQHVRINTKGSADTENHGKFDNQVCYAGTRFCFEIEMVATDKDTSNFDKVLNTLKNQTFRIGSGTRNGLGDIKIVDLQTQTLDLANGGLKDYLRKASNLDSDFWNKNYSPKGKDKDLPDGWDRIYFEIKAKDFFLFGSGFGDEDVDMTPVSDAKVEWDKKTKTGELKEKLVLMPATSLKGALAHRVAYHWNRLNRIFIGGKNDVYKYIAGDKITNPAVKVLFGYEENRMENGKQVTIQTRGNLIFSDVIQNEINPENENTQVHVSIDRFTGGAKSKSGALFTEKNVFGEGIIFPIEIFRDNTSIQNEAKAVFDSLPDELKMHIGSESAFLDTTNKALDAAICDLKKGMLPLGGGSSRGNGVFVEAIN